MSIPWEAGGELEDKQAQEDNGSTWHNPKK